VPARPAKSCPPRPRPGPPRCVDRHELETTPIQAGLNRAEHGTIEIAEPYRDLLDGTPVVDLKPHVTRFDRPPGDPRCGWLDQLTISDGTTPEQLA
jgi:tRNA (Thr-GGU) A37 N-methylase